jgi:hypothetical protein
MALIRTTNGSVITQNNRVSCECCEINLDQNVDFGEFGECDCATAECLQTRRIVQTFILQGATGPSPNNITGWRNIVSRASVVRISGTVGADIAIYQRTLGQSYDFAEQNNFVLPQNFNSSIYYMDDVVPNDGEFPCGTCNPPRNGPHALSFQFVLWPYTLFYIELISYIDCNPWTRLRLFRVGNFTPP